MLQRKRTDKKIIHKAFLTKKRRTLLSLRTPQNIATHFSDKRI